MSKSFPFCLLLFLLLACAAEPPPPLPYCEMLRKDQMNVNTDKRDLEQFDRDRGIRVANISKNFDALIDYAKYHGFPQADMFRRAPADTCQSQAIIITMIHGAQIAPERFFSEDLTTFFQNEIGAGRLDARILRPCLAAARTTGEPSPEVLGMAERAEGVWFGNER